MALTNEQITAWLKVSTPQYRNILVEITGLTELGETIFYLTQKAYKNYVCCIKGGFSFSKQLPLPSIPNNDGITPSTPVTMSIGDIEIHNPNGIYDSLLKYIWTNRSCRVLIGDLRWDRADYITILEGITSKVDSKDINTLNIILTDKLQRLNAPITEQKVGGTGENKDTIIPFVLGEVCNMTPLLIDPLTYTYQVHPGPIEGIIEIRDNEVPVLATINTATGKFDFTSNPASVAPRGTLTCSVQGHKSGGTYSNKIGTLIKQVATEAGKASTRFDITDIDTDNIALADSLYPYPIGYTSSDKDNILTCIQSLAATVGGYVIMSKEGKLKLVHLVTRTSVLTVTQYDMEPNSFHISSILDVGGAVKLGYCKNWTIQKKDKVLGIPEKHKDLFEKEYRTVTIKNQTVIDNYKLTTEPVEEGTYLLTAADATTEATRRSIFRGVPRIVYKFTGLSTCLKLDLGDTIFLKYKRYGLKNGEYGVIVGLDFNWFEYKVVVSVLIDITDYDFILTENGNPIAIESSGRLLKEK